MKTRDLPAPDPRVETELMLCSDGSIYINSHDVSQEMYAGRAIFVGYALHQREIARRGREGLLTWAMRAPLGLGSDGRIYVPEAEVAEGDRGKRRVFRGFQATAAEKARMVVELHRMAFNVSCVRLNTET
ncbi:hypothetical protein [Polyangium spumosum]|uniref:Uncharacterized protein n=1 Tax=Polyangium spumosum TaxID=889282 RepID=A0A6N7PRX7_9BACT|nr:hypothetical protein [Polyangium spumosum]MRG92985.1 hypothetical protein [Polyangium spumosum]